MESTQKTHRLDEYYQAIIKEERGHQFTCDQQIIRSYLEATLQDRPWDAHFTLLPNEESELDSYYHKGAYSWLEQYPQAVQGAFYKKFHTTIAPAARGLFESAKSPSNESQKVWASCLGWGTLLFSILAQS